VTSEKFLKFRKIAPKVSRLGILMSRKRVVIRIVARETDVAKLTIVKIGKGPERLSALPPCLERDVQCQQAVDYHEDEVVAPQGVGRGMLVIFVRDECARRVFERH
jgi:hypothetical protein